MYFSLERRHNVTFHPFGILRHYQYVIKSIYIQGFFQGSCNISIVELTRLKGAINDMFYANYLICNLATLHGIELIYPCFQRKIIAESFGAPVFSQNGIHPVKFFTNSLPEIEISKRGTDWAN